MLLLEAAQKQIHNMHGGLFLVKNGSSTGLVVKISDMTYTDSIWILYN